MLLLVSFATMVLIDLVPGDPVRSILGESATPEQVLAKRAQLGLDQSVVSRYVDWLGNALHGDFGTSLQGNQDVGGAISQRLPVTLELAVIAALIALLLALPSGMYAAYRRGGWFDRATEAVSSALVSLPPFLTATIFVFFLAVNAQVLPVTGWVPLSQDPGENLRHAILPALALALPEAAVWMRLLRADMVATLQEPYVLAAVAKGMRPTNVVVRQALRPSAISLVTVAGLSLGRLVGGSIVVEFMFALPGLGNLMIESVIRHDIVMVQGLVFVVAVGYVVINLAVDVAVAYLDPRVRQG